MLSISFLPWVLLILASIIAVPVALKMSPGSGAASTNAGDGDESAELEGEEAAMLVDDFAADPNSTDAPFGDDAFA